MDSPRNILRAVKAAKRILIPLHLRPDGDAVGSALACYHFFRDLGKKVTVVSADPIPEIFLFLPGAKRIKVTDPSELPLERFDLVFLPDTGAPTRFSKAGKIELPPKVILINVDHHRGNPSFGDLNYIVEGAASAAEVLYDLFRLWKTPLTPEIANCLLTGIYTDTGGFLYPSTTADSLAKAANLIRKGADCTRVAEQSFRSWPPKALPLWSQILTNARIRKNVAYSQLPYTTLHKISYSQSELAGIRGFAVNNLLLAIQGVKAAVLFTEEKPRQARVTLRSVGNADVAKVAEHFGGGGHLNSAAFDYRGPLKKIISKTVKLLQGIV
ncbi:MAG: bifunctional oligoribonuclease/PAP phosphatase NrnA [candidate division WWE3 bacterium]|nr:bifunctional oligoribonuclease/PAP phosphatase NrnA [candidate division WWE3 bacterium]